VCPEWLSDGRDASALIEQSEAERIADKALVRILGEVFRRTRYQSGYWIKTFSGWRRRRQAPL